MALQRIAVWNLDLVYPIPGFLLLAVSSNYLTKVTGKIFSLDSKRESFSKNSENDGNHTLADLGSKESHFHGK